MTVPRRRLGIFGGTFDPVHLGHLILVSEIRAALNLDNILLVPNARSPFKTDQEISTESDRLAMLQLAAADTPWLDVSTLELDRGGVSFTIDTLKQLHREEPDSDLVFLMGADSLIDLPSWRDPEGIVALAEVAVACRPGVTPDVHTVESRLPAARHRIHVVETPLIELSSTGIRSRVRAGKPITFLVPTPVEHYIGKHGLYNHFSRTGTNMPNP